MGRAAGDGTSGVGSTVARWGRRRWALTTILAVLASLVTVPVALLSQPTLAGASPGSPDPGFGTGGVVTTSLGAGHSDVANGVAVQPDGKVVVAGYDMSSGGLQQFAVARYDADGTLDTTFGNGGTVVLPAIEADSNGDAGLAVAIEADGTIVAGGYASTTSGGGASSEMVLVGLTSAGQLDPAFGTNGISTLALGTTSQINGLAIDSSGRIVAAGQWDNGWAVARFSASGALDTTFNSAGATPGVQDAFPALVQSFDNANAVAIQPSDQKIVVAGSSNGQSDFGVARLNTDGTLDTSFATIGLVDTPVASGSAAVNGVAVQSTGQIVAVGQALDSQSNFEVAVARYTTAGALDTSFGSGGIVTTSINAGQDALGRAVAVQADDQIVVAGYAQVSASRQDAALLRYNSSDGSLDSSFGTGGVVTTNVSGSSEDVANALAIDPTTQRLVIAGSDTPSGGDPQFLVARYLTSSAPVLTKAFGASSIPVGGSTSLTLTVTNPNTTGLTGVAVNDNLPAGLVVASTPDLTNSCNGTATATAGAGQVTLSGGTIGGGSSCAVGLQVTGTTPGVANNTATVSSNEGGSGNSASASLTVIAPPTLTKAFGASSIPLDGSTSLTFSLANPNTVALSGIAFSDTLPAGLTVASSTSTQCGGTVTSAGGTGPIAFTGGTLAAGATCSFSVTVTGVSAGAQSNTTSTVTSNEGGTGGTASASVDVVAPPQIAKSFNPTTVGVGGTSTLTFIITNPAANDTAEQGVAFTDTLPSGLEVATPSNAATTCGTLTAVSGSGTVSLAGGSIDVGGTCTVTVSVSGTSAGVLSNSVTVSSTNGGTGNTATASLTAADVPSAPQGPQGPAPTAAAGVRSATVDWGPPASDGGTQVTGYTVTAHDLTTGTDGPVVSVGGSTLSQSVDGLAPGHEYTFSVTATNLAGTGPASALTNPVVPLAVAPTASQTSTSNGPTGTATASVGTPNTPGYVTATINGAGSVTVATFGSDPVGGFDVDGFFFDVSLSPSNAVTQLTFSVCGVEAGQTINWWDPLTLTYGPVSNQTAPSQAGSCVTVVVSTTSSPTLAQMVGTPFRVPPGSQGYTMATANGGVYTFGTSKSFGSLPALGVVPVAPVVGLAQNRPTGGYWLVAADGGIFAFNAPFYGSMGGTRLNAPVVGMAADPTTGGYWLVAADGGIFAFNAPFYGSMGGKPLNAPIVGMAADPTTGGYWLVAADGGIFAFHAPFAGSMGGHPLIAPVVGMAVDQQTGGYWLAAADGGVFAFNAPFYGSRGGVPYTKPVVGIAPSGAATGYWLAGGDGGVFAYGGANFFGSLASAPPSSPVVGITR